MSVTSVRCSEEDVSSRLRSWEGSSSRRKVTGRDAEVKHRLPAPGPEIKLRESGAEESKTRVGRKQPQSLRLSPSGTGEPSKVRECRGSLAARVGLTRRRQDAVARSRPGPRLSQWLWTDVVRVGGGGAHRRRHVQGHRRGRIDRTQDTEASGAWGDKAQT